jgi:hypothetical protein
MIHQVAGIALAVLVVGACTLLGANSAPTPPNGAESMPEPASVVVTGEPKVADQQVDITLLQLDQPDFRRDITFAAGNVILAGLPVSAGAYRLVGPRQACVLDVTLAPRTNTSVLLRSDSVGTCSLVVIGVNTNGY